MKFRPFFMASYMSKKDWDALEMKGNWYFDYEFAKGIIYIGILGCEVTLSW